MPKQGEIPLKGQGVSKLEIAEIEKAIKKYENKKEIRCMTNPISPRSHPFFLKVPHTDSTL